MTSIIELIRPEAAFDPETIATLSAALEEAWDRLLRSGSEGTRPAYARAMREVVARRIIDMAQHGVRDQAELAKGAVRFLAANYRLDEKRLPLKLGGMPETVSEISVASAQPVREVP
jgi:hypothetical protein